MNCERESGGRIGGEVSGGGGMVGAAPSLTFDQVEERLIEALRCWRRMPGGGRWPFAGDAPWHLMTRRTRLEAGEVKGMDVQRLLAEDDAEETRRWQGRERAAPLSREEIAAMEEASEWLTMLGEADRKVVVLALAAKASGRRVSWIGMLKALGIKRGAGALAQRYRRAISYLALRLGGAGHEAAMRMVQRRGPSGVGVHVDG